MTADIFQRIANAASAALSPLAFLSHASDEEVIAAIATLGFDVPIAPQIARDLGAASAAVADAAVALSEVEIDGGDATVATAQVVAAVSSWAALARTLGSRLRSELPPSFVTESQIDVLVEGRLYAALLDGAVGSRSPFASAILALLGVVERKEHGDDPALHQVAFVESVLRLDRISQLVQSPAALFGDVYGWGTPQLDAPTLFERALKLSLHFDQGAVYQFPPDELFDACGAPRPSSDGPEPMLEIPVITVAGGFRVLLSVFAPPSTGTAAQSLAATLELDGGTELDLPLSDELHLKATVNGDVGTGLLALLTPGQGLHLGKDAYAGSTQPLASGSLLVELANGAADDQTELVTVAGKGSLSVAQMFVQLAARAASGQDPELTISGGFRGARWTAQTADADSFVASAVPSNELASNADLALAWSSRTGVTLNGSGQLSTRIPLAETVGPLRLDGIELTAQVDGCLRFDVRFAGSLLLGPITASLDGVGVSAGVAFQPGDLGPVSTQRAFLPPHGVGLSISTSLIGGGGYIRRDEVSGRYDGALALRAGDVSLSAFGILDPNSPGGYSLAAIISAQFPPIQLGLGFTLKGVGGLIGVNRRIDTGALHAAMRGPGIESIFFPTDPIVQASRLLGDLATYFPAAPGQYVFGPAAKIGWGPRAIVEAEIAVLLELPAPMRIVLVGSVRAKLPTKDHPLITLQVDAVGELDIIERRLAIDATLRDSKVVGFPIIGDMAVRVAWGAQKMLVVSVGGFHSQFRPPPGFPTLRRVRIPIGADDDPRLDITGFLALTSNTAQIGAQVELYASAGPLNISGSVGFEALFQPLPLYFEVDLWAGVSLRRGTTVLAAVHFDGKLSGPTPWHVSGEACLSLWFVDLCVDFSASFGLSDLLELAETAILEVLLPVLQDSASWAGSLVAGVERLVTSAVPIDATAAEAKVTRVDPMAGLTVRQSVVPFNRPITKFAQSVPSDVSQLVVTEAKIDGNSVSFTHVTDWFAPAQFEDLSDADRLSREGFEQMDAGVSLAGDATAAGDELIVPLEYETVIVAPATPSPGPRFRPTLVAQLLSGQTGTRERSPQLVVRGGLPEEKFVIASVDDLSARHDLAPPSARGTAELALAAHIAANPSDAGAFVIVPIFEAA